MLAWGGRLYVANAGDCRAVLCRGGEALPLSRDHTADLDSERERVLAAGGSARQHGVNWRIGTAGLQVTRWAAGFSVLGQLRGRILRTQFEVHVALCVRYLPGIRAGACGFCWFDNSKTAILLQVHW